MRSEADGKKPSVELMAMLNWFDYVDENGSKSKSLETIWACGKSSRRLFRENEHWILRLMEKGKKGRPKSSTWKGKL